MRLIDADALKSIRSIQSADFNSIDTIRAWIDSAPTADITETVECQECQETTDRVLINAKRERRCGMTKKEAIEWLEAIREKYIFGGDEGFDRSRNEALDMAIEALSADRPKGKWVWNPNGMDWNIGAWVCSECRHKPETWWECDERYNPLNCAGSHFCGNCGRKMVGADMRGETK